ncbi:shikimate dehydrogenase [Clostridium sp. YIM B02569]|uniref:shikimate dehydrogenase n=1 Tax=Clostridium sp. YIM B02569 TaxID=2911967 RepID=UPI001EED47E6|nr:shikimate dehydrogenase [Clostridium sp. YIM B02569]
MEFYGILGGTLKHTISPIIHKKVFSLLNIEGAYKDFVVCQEDIGKFTEALKVLKIKGVNVTIPYKEEIMKYLDFISPEAEKIKAINTILLKNEKLYGYNTDYFGFGKIISKNNIKLKDEVVMVLGTGGGAKAIITFLLDEGVSKIYLVSRTHKNDEQYDDKIECVTYEEIEHIKGHVIINTTPVGMYPNVDVSPVGHKVIDNFNVLIDIVYNPKETKFLSLGRELNKSVYGGLTMLIYQAIKSEEIWQDFSISEEISEEISSYINEEFK